MRIAFKISVKDEVSPEVERAAFLGSAGLTILVRCLCNWKNYYDREVWARLRYLRCDNCFHSIDYTSLCVNDPLEVKGIYQFKETPERRAIVERLLKIGQEAVETAELIKDAGHEEQAHKVRNMAQHAINARTLLSIAWHDEDASQNVNQKSIS